MLFGLGFALALMIFSLAANAAGDGFNFVGMKLPPGFTATPMLGGWVLISAREEMLPVFRPSLPLPLIPRVLCILLEPQTG